MRDPLASQRRRLFNDRSQLGVFVISCQCDCTANGRTGFGLEAEEQ